MVKPDYRHSSMEAGIQSQGERSEGSVYKVPAIRGFWIAANPAAMTITPYPELRIE
jgi:hypothetical protein